jgi:molybdenum cofactor cytidylyltransferase
MGSFKPLLPFGGRPMIARVVETFAATEVKTILLVTGHEASRVEQAIAGMRAVCVHNPHYAQDMLTSVQAGVAALPDDAGAFFIALGDQPAVHPATVATMIRAWRAAGAPLVQPVFAGRHGHPVLFAAELMAEIFALRPGQTLKTIVQRYRPQALECPVDDPAVVIDVDTPQDYKHALRMWEGRREMQNDE